jgi:hypothetical protein
MEILTQLDKQGVPIGIAFAVAGSLLLLLLLLIIHQNTNRMYKSRIKRKVVGNVTDPNSTRTLHSMTHEEFNHLRLATLAAQVEAESYCRMTDEKIVETIEGNCRACEGAGIEIPPFELPIAADLREFFAQRAACCTGLLARMEEQVKTRVSGITPMEFMHLVTSVQAACREAVLALSVSEEMLALAFDQAGRIRAELGLPFVHPYERFGPGYHAFFGRRLKVLEAVLWRINQPYPGLEYEDTNLATFA